MILVDTSVWVDHLRGRTRALAPHLERAEVLCHPFIVGELACENLRRRHEVLSLLASLPQAPSPSHAEALSFVEDRGLMGKGLGWIDVHLLAATALAGAVLWTADRRLAAAASNIGAGFEQH